MANPESGKGVTESKPLSLAYHLVYPVHRMRREGPIWGIFSGNKATRCNRINRLPFRRGENKANSGPPIFFFKGLGKKQSHLASLGQAAHLRKRRVGAAAAVFVAS